VAGAGGGGEGCAEFDEILGAAPEEARDDIDRLFGCNDVGVTGLVFVLSAAGYATCYSCRGHADLACERVPQVPPAPWGARAMVALEYGEDFECDDSEIDWSGI
jgi:hypothetical protein